MAGKKGTKKPKAPPTERQQTIESIRAIPRLDRSADQILLLATLCCEERRDRFLRLYVRRVKNARKALVNVARLANAASYDCTPEEGAQIVDVIGEDYAALKRAFTGTTKERGLFDL